MPELAITIRADGVQLTPGTSAAISVEVRNLGTIVDRYRCELVGFDPSWYTVTPASMELFPQGEGGSTRADAPPSVGRFQVTLHPPRTSAAKAGPWPFGAKVTSEHDPANRRVEEGSVVFLPFGALEADLRPAVVSGRFGTNASLQLTNRGNRPEQVEITGTDRAARITFDIQPPRLTLAPGETDTVPIGLSAGGARLVGGTETRPFSIDVRTAQFDTPPVTLSGTLEKLAIIPSGLPVAIGGLIALSMGAFAIWAAFLRPPSPPVPAAVATIVAPTPIIITAPPAATLPPTPQPTASPTPEPSASAPPSPSPTPPSLQCLQGPIDVALAALGGTSSFLGFALSCDATLPDGGVSRDFQGGSMYVAPGTPTAFALSAPLRDYWLSIGGPASALGYPAGNAAPNPNVAGGWSAAFQHGQASWDPTAGGSFCTGLQCLVIRPLKSFPIFVINP
jgi:hypothetical protein